MKKLSLFNFAKVLLNFNVLTAITVNFAYI